VEIIKHTAAELVLCDRWSSSAKNAIVTCCAIFSAIPAIIMVNMIAATGVMKLSCQRIDPAQIRCVQSESTLLGLWPKKPKSYNYISEAGLQYGHDTLVLWLSTASGSVEMEQAISLQGEMQETADKINEFIKSDRSTLLIQHDRRLNPLLIAGIVFASIVPATGMRIVYAVLFSSQTITLDKASNQMLLEIVTGKRTVSSTSPITEITDFAIDTRTDGDGDTLYYLKIVPQSVYPHHIIVSADRTKVEEMQSTIQSFLDSTNEG
jgi:hypothetical protein